MYLVRVRVRVRVWARVRARVEGRGRARARARARVWAMVSRGPCTPALGDLSWRVAEVDAIFGYEHHGATGELREQHCIDLGVS